MGSEQETVRVEFLAITHAASSNRLYISPDHFLFMTKRDGDPQMLPARDLSVGDMVFARSAKKTGELMPSTVTSIETVVDIGIYAPFTWTGRLMVDDVLVSNYAIFSTTLQKTHTQHQWLPWERVMNIFNPFRYFFGCGFASDMFDTAYPSWMES